MKDENNYSKLKMKSSFNNNVSYFPAANHAIPILKQPQCVEDMKAPSWQI